jgi:hypothetical protein
LNFGQETYILESWQFFPLDILNFILSLIDLDSVGNALLVCKQWKKILDEQDRSWEYRYQKHFGGPIIETFSSWKELYEETHSEYLHFHFISDEESSEESSEDSEFDSSDSNEERNTHKEPKKKRVIREGESDEEEPVIEDEENEDIIYPNFIGDEEYDSSEMKFVKWIVASGHYQVARKFIQLFKNLGDEFELDILWCALEDGFDSLCKVLLEEGAVPDAILHPSRGYPSLLWAAIDVNNVEMLKVFLQEGADPNHEVDAELDFLSLAVVKNNYEMVELLLSHGANVAGFDWMRGSPFQFATTPEILQLLIDHEAKDSWYDNGNGTTMMRLVESDNIPMLEVVLKNPTCWAKPNSIKESIEIAKKEGKKKVLTMLQSVSTMTKKRKK